MNWVFARHHCWTRTFGCDTVLHIAGTPSVHSTRKLSTSPTLGPVKTELCQRYGIIDASFIGSQIL